MVDGSLAPGFSSDGSGQPANADSPDGNLEVCQSVKAWSLDDGELTCTPACPPTLRWSDAL